MIKKRQKNLHVTECRHLDGGYVLLKLCDRQESLPQMIPGQFVQVLCATSPSTLLRRPISIHYVNREDNELWLLVHAVGAGTRALAALHAGDEVNVLFPLGNGFSMERPQNAPQRVLLVGGGVGLAPLLFMGEALRAQGDVPLFLLGGKSEKDILQREMFQQYGETFFTTEDATLGEQGFVTQHSLWQSETLPFHRICSCGPKPMMKAVAAIARERNIPCEVSLENLMACGLGACLCCVEKNRDGHNVCVCKDGPVFNINLLQW